MSITFSPVDRPESGDEETAARENKSRAEESNLALNIGTRITI